MSIAIRCTNDAGFVIIMKHDIQFATPNADGTTCSVTYLVDTHKTTATYPGTLEALLQDLNTD